jgi:hypothetical protein
MGWDGMGEGKTYQPWLSGEHMAVVLDGIAMTGGEKMMANKASMVMVRRFMVWECMIQEDGVFVWWVFFDER